LWYFGDIDHPPPQVEGPRKDNGHWHHLGPFELLVIDDSLVVHPPHQAEVGPYRGQLLALAEMLVHHVRQHIVPRQRRVIFRTLDPSVVAQETCGKDRQLVSSEVGKDVHFKVNNVGKHLVTVQDLERTQQVCIFLVPEGNCQDAILRFS
jgi:hypothetical protein